MKAALLVLALCAVGMAVAQPPPPQQADAVPPVEPKTVKPRMHPVGELRIRRNVARSFPVGYDPAKYQRAYYRDGVGAMSSEELLHHHSTRDPRVEVDVWGEPLGYDYETPEYAFEHEIRSAAGIPDSRHTAAGSHKARRTALTDRPAPAKRARKPRALPKGVAPAVTPAPVRPIAPTIATVTTNQARQNARAVNSNYKIAAKNKGSIRRLEKAVSFALKHLGELQARVEFSLDPKKKQSSTNAMVGNAKDIVKLQKAMVIAIQGVGRLEAKMAAVEKQTMSNFKGSPKARKNGKKSRRNGRRIRKLQAGLKAVMSQLSAMQSKVNLNEKKSIFPPAAMNNRNAITKLANGVSWTIKAVTELRRATAANAMKTAKDKKAIMMVAEQLARDESALKEMSSLRTAIVDAHKQIAMLKMQMHPPKSGVHDAINRARFAVAAAHDAAADAAEAHDLALIAEAEAEVEAEEGSDEAEEEDGEAEEETAEEETADADADEEEGEDEEAEDEEEGEENDA
jgi:hypothetical protein